jgi:hypothetical protein
MQESETYIWSGNVIFGSAPFKGLEGEPRLALYVTFLAVRPSTMPLFPILDPQEALEAIGLKELDVLLVSRPKSTGFYGFPNNFIDKTFGVPGESKLDHRHEDGGTDPNLNLN